MRLQELIYHIYTLQLMCIMSVRGDLLVTQLPDAESFDLYNATFPLLSEAIGTPMLLYPIMVDTYDSVTLANVITELLYGDEGSHIQIDKRGIYAWIGGQSEHIELAFDN